MPYGESGILLIDFITSIQKKFNLVIYPNKTKLNEFIIEPFSNWYKTGQIKDFNRYINLNEKIDATPANNLAPQRLNFQDTLDSDYISQQFSKAAGREYGKQYYVDTENYFSQGTFDVKTGMASSPLIQIPGTGDTLDRTCTEFFVEYTGAGPASSSIAFWNDCDGVLDYEWFGGSIFTASFCAEKDTVLLAGLDLTATIIGLCGTGSALETINRIYIPTFISSVTYQPARVLPHIYFYNGLKGSQEYIVEHFLDGTPYVVQTTVDYFPYFDNYSGNNPTTESKSLLFLNETAVYGEAPTASLYSEYWSTYVDLLYKPTTRLFNCQAIIPLADYFKMELNDIVEWRGNYYHLRALNDYNLSNGECSLQLLGPILGDVISNILPVDECYFDFSITTP
jgi:hypothetical protein